MNKKDLLTIGGMVVGFVVGYMLGKKSVKSEYDPYADDDFDAWTEDDMDLEGCD